MPHSGLHGDDVICLASLDLSGERDPQQGLFGGGGRGLVKTRRAGIMRECPGPGYKILIRVTYSVGRQVGR